MPDYRLNHSCKTSLVRLVSDILWDFENQNLVALVGLDLNTAIDTVDHEVLLNVLSTSFGDFGSA